MAVARRLSGSHHNHLHRAVCRRLRAFHLSLFTFHRFSLGVLATLPDIVRLRSGR